MPILPEYMTDAHFAPMTITHENRDQSSMERIKPKPMPAPKKAHAVVVLDSAFSKTAW